MGTKSGAITAGYFFAVKLALWGLKLKGKAINEWWDYGSDSVYLHSSCILRGFINGWSRVKFVGVYKLAMPYH